MKRDINYLLDLYKKPFVKGEKRTKEYDKMIKRKQSKKGKEETAKDLFNEVPFHLTDNDKEQVFHLIKMYPNFRKLHGNASNETVILAFIFYVKIPYNSNIKLSKYTITRKYKLTHDTFEIIICRLALEYLKNVYIVPVKPKDKNHNILSKGEIR